MTLGTILGQLYERLNYQSSPAAAVTTRLTNVVNEAQRRILREPGLALVRDTTEGLTFASEASRAIYGLPASLSRIRAISERTNDRALSAKSLADLRLSDPGLNATGTPWAYVPLSYRPIARLPASTGVWAVSSSASDTTQTIQIAGIRSAGALTGDQTVTLNGATRVALGGASAYTDYVDVTAVSLSAAAVGTVTLYDAAAAGNAIAVIPIGATYPQYFVVQLYPIPDAAITYYVDGTLRMPELDDADDVPLLPEEFHDLLVYGALMLEYEKNDDSRFALAERLYTKGLSRLKYAVASQPGDVPVLGRAPSRGSSRLGAWTPTGSGW
jgi:hypothetical protein